MMSNTNSSTTVYMSPLESFNFGIKYLWVNDPNARVKVNIVDTIIFKEGKPFYWIFTSEKTGEVLKKKADRLKSLPDILKAIKMRTKALKGCKNGQFKSKIATIWYMERNDRVTSFVVDEMELHTIANSKYVNSLISLQVCMGGYPLKGNGMFEHRMWTQKDGMVNHATYESELSGDYSVRNVFTSGQSRVRIVENHHVVLSSLCNLLVRHFLQTANTRITDLTFQAVFSANHTPFIVYYKKFGIVDPPAAFFNDVNRAAFIYPTGEAPPSIEVNPMSLALTAELWQMDNQGVDMKVYKNYSSEIDRRPSEALTKDEKLARREVDPTAMRSILASNKTPRVANRKSSSLRLSVDVVGTPLPAIDQTPLLYPTSSEELKTKKYTFELTSEMVSLKTDIQRNIPTFGQHPVTQYTRTDPYATPHDLTKSTVHHNHSAPIFVEKLKSTADMSKAKNTTTLSRPRPVYRPDSADSVLKLRQSSQLAQFTNASNHNTISRSRAANLDGEEKEEFDKSTTFVKSSQLEAMSLFAPTAKEDVDQHHLICTQATQAAGTFYQRQFTGSSFEVPLAKDVFEARRPLSAPHPKSPAVARLSVPSDSNGDEDINMRDDNSPRRDATHSGHLNRNSSWVHRRGVTCFGMYCSFDNRVKNAVMGLLEPHMKHEARCKDCPRKIAFKSIMLAVAETKFVGSDMDENIESFVEQMKLSGLSVSWIDRYVNRPTRMILTTTSTAGGVVVYVLHPAAAQSRRPEVPHRFGEDREH